MYANFIKRVAPYQQVLWIIILVQSMVATLASLYYSTFGDPMIDLADGTLFGGPGGFTPCELCWYARILMYPIVLLTLIGILRKDSKFSYYVLALSLPGILLELYHYSLQKFPIITITECSAVNPCNAMEVNYFGFITIPFLCLVAFIVISIAAILNNQIVNYRETKAMQKIS